jgi:hypothetical protein
MTGQMTRRTLLSISVAACLRADSDDDIKALVNSAAEALSNRDEQQFLAAFDPAMKGYRELTANVHGLLRDADVQAGIVISGSEIASSELSGSEISSGQMNWTLDIAAHDLSAGSTRRQAKVLYRAERTGGKLRIVSFEPVSIFAPPHGREAWDAVSGAAMDLQVASRRAEGRDENNLPNLLGRFDRAMTGYAQLAANLEALTSIWVVEPAIQLTGNEGGDDRRSLEIDWVMTLTSPLDGGRSLRKEETVKCAVEKRGKRWLIVSFTPLELFAPPGP